MSYVFNVEVKEYYANAQLYLWLRHCPVPYYQNDTFVNLKQTVGVQYTRGS